MNEELPTEVVSGPWSVAGGVGSYPPLNLSAHSSVARFTFPLLVPEPLAGSTAAEAPKAIWPECHDDKKASACAEMADAMMRQLSDEEAVSPCPPWSPKVVALTSPGDGDGKTDLLLGLAPQLAQRITGGILVVDADLSNPGLTTRLEMPPDMTTGQSLLIYPTNLHQLNVLPAPLESVSRSFDRSWIEEFREGWPLVLLDMASLADTGVARLACCCDGVYLVVRLGHTSRRAVAQAAQLIRHCGGRLFGCLVVG